MNLLNLQKAQEYIKTIPQDQFSMLTYRRKPEDAEYHQCGTVGCIIGWCTILDTPANVEKFRTVLAKDNLTNRTIKLIEFTGWSQSFFDICPYSSVDYKESKIWEWLFSGAWARWPETNTVEHAVYRIQRVLDGFRPNTWDFKEEIERLGLEF